MQSTTGIRLAHPEQAEAKPGAQPERERRLALDHASCSPGQSQASALCTRRKVTHAPAAHRRASPLLSRIARPTSSSMSSLLAADYASLAKEAGRRHADVRDVRAERA